jgi:pimeloyl-ACP methyl ester carboxylesterase
MLGALAAGKASARELRHKHASTVVLVHGSWQGASSFELLRQHLELAGHTVIAPSLPGHGFDARFPPSYFVNPRPASFATDPSPLRNITVADYVKPIAGVVKAAAAATGRPVVLVGHSLGGIVLHGVGELLGPGYIKALVYLSAFLPKNQTPLGFYINLPSQADSGVPPLLRADPAAVGALRIDPNASDPSYVAAARHAFYADVPEALFLAALNGLQPDDPFLPFATAVTTTRARWGAIPRFYVHSTQDFAIRPATQKLMVADADAFTPNNKTTVLSIKAGHSSFLAQPKELAGLLLPLLGQR